MRAWVGGLLVLGLFFSNVARADDIAPAPPPPPSSSPSSTPPPSPPPATDIAPTPPPTVTLVEQEAPTSPLWKDTYEGARIKLLNGEFVEAAMAFADLEKTATNYSDRRLAHEHLTLAREWAGRGLAFVKKTELPDSHASARAVDHRTTDEIVSLYSNAVVYGVGTGTWLAIADNAQSTAGVVLPIFLTTGAAVGGVVLLDSGRGLRYGVGQSIVSGMYIGLEEGMVWTIAANTNTFNPPSDSMNATLIWGGATIGAVTGGIVGQLVSTTPGRAAFVGSSALWIGSIAGLTTGGLANNGQTGWIAAGIGVTAGTGIGAFFASDVSPSIWRVRLLDVGGVLGALAGAGLYAAAANQNSDGNALAGSTAAGIALGLGLTWWLTNGMAPELPADPTPPKTSVLSHATPTIAPVPRGTGMTFGFAGTL